MFVKLLQLHFDNFSNATIALKPLEKRISAVQHIKCHCYSCYKISFCFTDLKLWKVTSFLEDSNSSSNRRIECLDCTSNSHLTPFVHSIDFFFRLFANKKPRSSWMWFNASVYCQLILCILWFSTWQNIFLLPKRFLINFIICHTSNMTCICGWEKWLWMFQISLLEQSLVTIGTIKNQCNDIHILWVQQANAIIDQWCLDQCEILLFKKHSIGCFQWLSNPTNHENQCLTC